MYILTPSFIILINNGNLSKMDNFGILKSFEPINSYSEFPIRKMTSEIIGYHLADIPPKIIRHMIGITIDEKRSPVLCITPEAISHHITSGDLGPVLAHELGHWHNNDPILRPEQNIEIEIRADKFAAEIFGKKTMQRVILNIAADIPSQDMLLRALALT